LGFWDEAMLKHEVAVILN